MKILKVSGYISMALTGIIVLMAIYLQWRYTSYDPKIKYEVQVSDLKYFTESYEESQRAYFKLSSELSEEFESVVNGKIHVPSMIDSNLFIDYCYIPQKNADKIMIMVSGIHGTEGYIGSAMQQLFVEEYLDQNFTEKSALLLIHGMNPYGFKYNRRVTENNVDLNRNSHVDSVIFLNKNPGYEMVDHIINPKKPVNLKDPLHKYFVFYAFKMIFQKGMNTLRQAIMQGQYSTPRGIYFGGKAFEPQITKVNELLDSICKPYNTIFALDVHSGYGERGKVHLFLNPYEKKTR
jgi:hypothetical protein